MVVAPANKIPHLVQQNGGKIIMVNTTETLQDQYADVMLIGKAGEVIPKLVDAVKQKLRRR